MSFCLYVITVVLDVNLSAGLMLGSGSLFLGPGPAPASAFVVMRSVDSVPEEVFSIHLCACECHIILTFVHMGVFTCKSHRESKMSGPVTQKSDDGPPTHTHGSPHGSLSFIWLIMLQCEDTGDSSWLNMCVLLCSGRHTHTHSTYTHSMTHNRQAASHVKH